MSIKRTALLAFVATLLSLVMPVWNAVQIMMKIGSDHPAVKLSTIPPTLLIILLSAIMPLFYFGWSVIWGRRAGPNPWQATGLEWTTSSPPPKHNFERSPVVTLGPYSYDPEDHSFVTQDGTHYAA